jgi:hypothetical protein
MSLDLAAVAQGYIEIDKRSFSDNAIGTQPRSLSDVRS